MGNHVEVIHETYALLRHVINVVFTNFQMYVVILKIETQNLYLKVDYSEAVLCMTALKYKI